MDLDDAEDAYKAIARRRDGRCRWPHCELCRRYKKLPLDVAHVLQAKGMSGDRTLVRSHDQRLMLLDRITHGHQENHDKVVVALTDEGTAGPCEFWLRDGMGVLFLVARESAPFVYERD